MREMFSFFFCSVVFVCSHVYMCIIAATITLYYYQWNAMMMFSFLCIRSRTVSNLPNAFIANKFSIFV